MAGAAGIGSALAAAAGGTKQTQGNTSAKASQNTDQSFKALLGQLQDSKKHHSQITQVATPTASAHANHGGGSAAAGAGAKA